MNINDLVRNSTAASLKQVGISLSSEGRLVINTAKTGLQLDKTASQELAVNGAVGSRMAAALQALGQATGSSSDSQFGGSGYGLSAYQNS